MAVEFGSRSAGAIGYQGKQGAFDVEPEMPRAGLLPQDGVNAELLPGGFKHIDVAIGPGADQPPVAAGTYDSFRGTTAQDALG